MMHLSFDSTDSVGLSRGRREHQIYGRGFVGKAGRTVLTSRDPSLIGRLTRGRGGTERLRSLEAGFVFKGGPPEENEQLFRLMICHLQYLVTLQFCGSCLSDECLLHGMMTQNVVAVSDVESCQQSGVR